MVKRKTIFDISSEYLEYLDALEENNGEMTDEIFERLNINKDEAEEKILNYFHFNLQLKAEAATLKDRAKQITTKAKTKLNTVERIKKLMAIAVRVFGEPTKTGSKRYKGKEFSASFIYNEPLVILKDAEIPPEYDTNTVTFSGLTNEEVQDMENYLKKWRNYRAYTSRRKVTTKVDEARLKQDTLNAGKGNEPVKGVYIDEQGGYLRIT